MCSFIMQVPTCSVSRPCLTTDVDRDTVSVLYWVIDGAKRRSPQHFNALQTVRSQNRDAGNQMAIEMYRAFLHYTVVQSKGTQVKSSGVSSGTQVVLLQQPGNCHIFCDTIAKHAVSQHRPMLARLSKGVTAVNKADKQ